AVGRLAARVAQEVRNPLTCIKLLTEAALRPADPQPLNEEDLRVILGEVVRLERTVQRFLSFAHLPPEPADADVLEKVSAPQVAAADVNVNGSPGPRPLSGGGRSR